ncbi:MAG: hypothetical protein E7382_03875 [Clostridiales bacterium]|nr:hypothetical protein [Clostridiales bacterium]
MRLARKIISIIVAAVSVFGVVFGIVLYNNSLTTMYEVKLENDNRTIFNFTGNYSYRYGPSIIRTGTNAKTGEGIYEALFSSDPTLYPRSMYPEISDEAADVLTYRKSEDGGKTWSEEILSLVPTANSDDKFSVCDPGWIKVDDMYYCTYTSTRYSDAAGTYNHVFVARTKTPTDYTSWKKWNGKDWGGSASPIVYYHGSAKYYGIGEPCILLLDGTIYLYYTYDGTLGNGKKVHQTRLATAPFCEDWPSKLQDKGVAMNRDDSEDSMDVKYDDTNNIFLAIDTYNRFSRSSRVKFCVSYDGLNFKELNMSEDSSESLPRVHNAGIAGDSIGHIDTEVDNFVCYAYQPDDGGWGKWNTAVQSFSCETKTYRSLEKATGNVAVGDEEVSPSTIMWSLTDYFGVNATEEEKSAKNAIKGSGPACFTSEGHNYSLFEEVLCLRTSGKVNGVSVTCAINCFPVRFKFQYSNDSNIWYDVDGGKIYESSNYNTSPGSEIKIDFEKPLNAKYVRFVAVELTKDQEDGKFYLKIMEFYDY